jgi:anion-transporting  ArsA/GET3 family ATPase
MAMEKLYELTESGRFDTVVVDTPPTRNALDLLDAPRRLTHFLENRIFRALLMPTRVYFRAVGIAAQAVLRTIAKVAGAEIVQDAVTFFQAFGGMEEGFAERASAVRALLALPSTAYVLVTSPRQDSLDEASFFAERLAETGVAPAALVVNRVHPRFGTTTDDDATAPPVGSALATLYANLATLDAQATRDAAAIAELASRVAPAPVATVPLLASDVHDLAGLALVADQLFAPAESKRAAG